MGIGRWEAGVMARPGNGQGGMGWRVANDGMLAACERSGNALRLARMEVACMRSGGEAGSGQGGVWWRAADGKWLVACERSRGTL